MDFGNDNNTIYPVKTWPTRIIGAGIAALCLLLLLSLWSYDIREMGWTYLNPQDAETAAARPCSNLLGTVGLYLAGLLYAFLGAAAPYAVLLSGMIGAGMLAYPATRRAGQWIALIIMLLCACAFLAIQPWLWVSWAQQLHLSSPGGALGYLDGACVAEPLLGARWAMVAMLVLHAIALIYFCRATPATVGRTLWNDTLTLIQHIQEKRRKRKEERQYAEAQWKASFPPPAPAIQPPSPQATAPAATPQPAVAAPLPPPSSPPVRQPVRQAPLPPRQRPTIQPERAPLNPSPVQTSPPPPTRETPPPHREIPQPRPRSGQATQAEERSAPPARQRSTGDNLLDLMRPVEEDIERESDMAFGDHARPHMPRNLLVERAINRHFGYNGEPLEETEEEAPAPGRHRIPEPPAPTYEPSPDEPPLGNNRINQQPYSQRDDYRLPPYDLLEFKPVPEELTRAVLEEKERVQNLIIDTLETFKINVEPGPITRGPSFTRYEFFPPKGLRVNRIANLHNDLMLATQSETVNILAPVPGRNTVGIELANETKSPVYLRELLQSEDFHNPKLRIPVALGKNVYGTPVIGDLAAMPHTLVAGTTGSGKSVCINSMILSMLYKFRPDELKLILVDPKVVEMQPYRKLPHLACPVVTEPARVIGALRWAVNEMEHRYRMFSKMGVRNFEDFNNRPEDFVPEPEEEDVPEDYEPLPEGFSSADAIVRDIEDSQGADLGEEEQEELDFEAEERIPAKIPYIVIIIDELADLMQMVKEDLENYIARLTQKARAAGIHLVVATQTPRAQVLTGTIKANIPCRIALKVSSPLDSRIILDTAGAENLLGKGDLLFLPPGGITKLCRAQGAWVSDAEIASIIKFCASQAKQKFEQGVTTEMNNADGSAAEGDNGGRLGGKGVSDDDAELYTRCVNLVVTERKASTSLLQRRFSIGYGRAAKIMDLMEERGVIGPSQGASRPREVLVDAP